MEENLKENYKISIIGAGGVGGYFGGKLAAAGFNVHFIARGKHLEAMKKTGLTVKSIDGDFHVQNISASNDFQTIANSQLIIPGVKAWQVKELARSIQPFIKDDTTILPLQNGVMAEEELSEFIDKKHILHGLCRIISKIESPGVINHFGVPPVVIFGEENNEQTPRVKKIKEIFDASGIVSKIPESIQAETWKKFITICVSGLLAISNTNYGELRSIPETRKMMTDLFNEIYDLSQKMGIPIKPDFVSKTIAFIDTFPPETTSSLTRDVWEGKPSEIEYQNGTVVRLGKKWSVPVPVNEFVYNCILPMEMKARGTIQ